MSAGTPAILSPWLLTLADRARQLREELAVLVAVIDEPASDRVLAEAIVDLDWVERDIRSVVGQEAR